MKLNTKEVWMVKLALIHEKRVEIHKETPIDEDILKSNHELRTKKYGNHLLNLK